MIRYDGIEIDTIERTITHAGVTKKFDNGSRSFEKVCYFILGDRVTLEAAFNRFYGDDPDGGPIAGPQVFNIDLNRWQHLYLNRLRLEWRGYVVAGTSFYEIVPKRRIADPQRFARMSQRGGAPIPWTRSKRVQHVAHA
jgi:hypothetical protein